jgi:hypothetical protein
MAPSAGRFVKARTPGALISAKGIAPKGRKDIPYDLFDRKHRNEHDQLDP